MAEKTCITCRYVQPVDGQTPSCRRYPPYAHAIVVLRQAKVQILAAKEGQMVPVEENRSLFPSVRPEWTCGEWAAKIELAS